MINAEGDNNLVMQEPLPDQAGAMLQHSGDGWVLSGDMSFATVAGLLRSGASGWSNAVPAWIDLRLVAHIDSAGLVLLLEWLRNAKREGRQIQLRSIPPQLLTLAGFYDIQSAFSCDNQ